MDELLCVIELLIVAGPQHTTDKSFKVQESLLLLKIVTPRTLEVLNDSNDEPKKLEVLIKFSMCKVKRHLMMSRRYVPY